MSYIGIAALIALSASQISYAQDFLAPIQAKINSIKQGQDAAQIKYLGQKQQMEAAATSSIKENDENASSTQEIRDAIEKKIGRPLDNDRMKIAQDFESALKNLNDLIQRIDSRMTKMQTAGADVSSSSALFDTTKTNVDISLNNLTNLEKSLGEPTATSTRKAILARIKTQSDKTKSSLETAYRSIMSLIDSLKQVSLNTEPSASSTTDIASSSRE